MSQLPNQNDNEEQDDNRPLTLEEQRARLRQLIIMGKERGYITYAGAHRYLDSGLTGPEHVTSVHRASFTGILVTGVMRYVLFLAILGVVASGVVLDTSTSAANPAGQAFGAVLGPVALAWGLQHTSGASASLMLTLEALFTALLAWRLYHETMDRRVWAAMLLLLAGGVALAWVVQWHLAPCHGAFSSRRQKSGTA